MLVQPDGEVVRVTFHAHDFLVFRIRCVFIFEFLSFDGVNAYGTFDAVDSPVRSLSVIDLSLFLSALL